MLVQMDWAYKWVDLVMKMVTSVAYKYKINGFVSRKLIPSRGLCQGDPLSPYLFIHVVDVLSHMLLKAKEQGRIKGINLSMGGPNITHLFFADDSLLFAKATEEEMYQLIQILNLYSRAFGQRINVNKSGLIGGRFISQQYKRKLADILSIQVWEHPSKYLGLPANWSRRRTSEL